MRLTLLNLRSPQSGRPRVTSTGNHREGPRPASTLRPERFQSMRNKLCGSAVPLSSGLSGGLTVVVDACAPTLPAARAITAAAQRRDMAGMLLRAATPQRVRPRDFVAVLPSSWALRPGGCFVRRAPGPPVRDADNTSPYPRRHTPSRRRLRRDRQICWAGTSCEAAAPAQASSAASSLCRVVTGAGRRRAPNPRREMPPLPSTCLVSASCLGGRWFCPL